MKKPPEPSDFLPDFLRDYGSVLKTKNLYFAPFFLAFLGFLLTQKAYVSGAPWTVKILCIVTLVVCSNYAYIIIALLTQLESLALFFNLNKKTDGHFFNWVGVDEAETKKAEAEIRSDLNRSKVQKLLSREGKAYHTAMYSLYFCAMFVLVDMYLTPTIDWYLR